MRESENVRERTKESTRSCRRLRIVSASRYRPAASPVRRDYYDELLYSLKEKRPQNERRFSSMKDNLERYDFSESPERAYPLYRLYRIKNTQGVLEVTTLRELVLQTLRVKRGPNVLLSETLLFLSYERLFLGVRDFSNTPNVLPVKPAFNGSRGSI